MIVTWTLRDGLDEVFTFTGRETDGGTGQTWTPTEIKAVVVTITDTTAGTTTYTTLYTTPGTVGVQTSTVVPATTVWVSTATAFVTTGDEDDQRYDTTTSASYDPTASSIDIFGTVTTATVLDGYETTSGRLSTTMTGSQEELLALPNQGPISSVLATRAVAWAGAWAFVDGIRTQSLAGMSAAADASGPSGATTYAPQSFAVPFGGSDYQYSSEEVTQTIFPAETLTYHRLVGSTVATTIPTRNALTAGTTTAERAMPTTLTETRAVGLEKYYYLAVDSDGGSLTPVQHAAAFARTFTAQTTAVVSDTTKTISTTATSAVSTTVFYAIVPVEDFGKNQTFELFDVVGGVGSYAVGGPATGHLSSFQSANAGVALEATDTPQAALSDAGQSFGVGVFGLPSVSLQRGVIGHSRLYTREFLTTAEGATTRIATTVGGDPSRLTIATITRRSATGADDTDTSGSTSATRGIEAVGGSQLSLRTASIATSSPPFVPFALGGHYPTQSATFAAGVAVLTTDGSGGTTTTTGSITAGTAPIAAAPIHHIRNTVAGASVNVWTYPYAFSATRGFGYSRVLGGPITA